MSIRKFYYKIQVFVTIQNVKSIFIINSIAGKKSGCKTAALIEKVAKEEKLDYKLIFTDHPGHAKELAKSYSNRSDCEIYAVGGDGTIFEVLNGLDTKTPLGIIPSGSGNDFFRYFANNSSLEDIIRETIKAEPHYVDYGIANGQRFLNTTSFGMDAKINLDASSYIRKTILNKSQAYLYSIFRNVINLKPIKVKITADDKTFTDEYFICAIMNGKYYGNGVKAAPNALIDDAYLDVILFKKASRFKTYQMLIKYLRGKHTEKDGFIFFKAKKLLIEADKELPCQSDGENYYTKRIEVNIVSSDLKIKTVKGA